jgi:transcriptional regulator with XRE-family HTH domain
MSGHKPFKKLSDTLQSTPEGYAAVERERRILRDVLALSKLREARGVTQADLAKAWDVSQVNVSRVEHETDVYLSTLRSYVQALGGRLEINAVFPDQTIPLGLPTSEEAAPRVSVEGGARIDRAATEYERGDLPTDPTRKH